jgi:hypothetical protein
MARPSLLNLILLFALACAAIKSNWRLERQVDLDGWDETEYITIGLEIPQAGLPDARSEVFFTPLYSAWYLLLSRFQPDALALQDLNYRLLGVFLPCLLFLLLRSVGCTALGSVGAAFLLIVHKTSLDSPTRSGHFAVLMLAAGMFFATRTKSPVLGACALLLGSVAAAYARPEFALLVILVAGLLGWTCWRQVGAITRSEWVATGGVAVVIAALLFSVGAPMGAGNNRSMVAFSQHFSANHAAENPTELNPWSDCAIIIEQVFGPCKTVTDAIKGNPKAFLWQITYNARGVIRQFESLFLDHRSFLLPDGGRLLKLENALLVLFFVGFLLHAARKVRNGASEIFRRQSPLVLFAFAAIGVSSVSILLTSTQLRYFFPHVFFGLFLMVLFCCQEKPQPGIEAMPHLPLAILAGIVVIGMTPASSFHEARRMSFRSAIEEVARLKLDGPTGFLEALTSERVRIYVGPMCIMSITG